MNTLHPVLLFLLLLLVLVSYRAFNNQLLFERLKFNVGAVQRGEYYRLFTAAFIHVDFNHLLLNGFTLYVFGENALYGLGVLNFFVVYLIGLFAGNLFALYYHRKTPYYSAVGASGAIMGVVYSTILMFPDMQLALIFLPIPFPAYLFGLGYLAYTLFGMQAQNDGIGHTAHFGGAFGGILATIILVPQVLTHSFWTFVLMVAITLGFFFWRSKRSF